MKKGLSASGNLAPTDLLEYLGVWEVSDWDDGVRLASSWEFCLYLLGGACPKGWLSAGRGVGFTVAAREPDLRTRGVGLVVHRSKWFPRVCGGFCFLGKKSRYLLVMLKRKYPP